MVSNGSMASSSSQIYVSVWRKRVVERCIHVVVAIIFSLVESIGQSSRCYLLMLLVETMLLLVLDGIKRIRCQHARPIMSSRNTTRCSRCFGMEPVFSRRVPDVFPLCPKASHSRTKDRGGVIEHVFNGGNTMRRSRSCPCLTAYLWATQNHRMTSLVPGHRKYSGHITVA